MSAHGRAKALTPERVKRDGRLVSGPAAVDFALRGDHITLDALLKATGLAPSGGAAKALIADGGVTVDGAVERRRGCKLRAGALVQVADQAVRVCARGEEAAD